MYSTLPPAAIEFKPGEPLLLAWVEGTVPAGFSSPAADFAVKRHDLNDLGIADGDILVVNRALPPVHKCIVIAEVDGDFTVKQFYKRNGLVQLQSGNPTFAPILFKNGQTLTICGAVTAAIKRLR